MSGQRAIDQRVALCAAAQHGLVTRRQLITIGLHPDAVDSRVRSGRLAPVERGVYALGHAELRREGRLLAAVLASGSDAVLSHRSAAALWGLRPFGGTFVEVTIPSHRGRRRRADLRVHRSAELPATEVTRFHGIPITTVARTLLDLAALVPPHHLRRAIERAVELELFDLDELVRVLGAHPRRPGRPALLAVLADLRDHEMPRTRSDSEAAFLQLCLDHGLPRPQVNRFDGRREVDFRWPDQRLVAEVDGWTFHRDRRAFARDRARDRRLLAEGYRVARFTASEVAARPAALARELAALLGRSASGPRAARQS